MFDFFVCDDCDEAIASPGQLSFDYYGGTGYGIVDGRKVCYACCGKRDRQTMIDRGIFTGYLTVDRHGMRFVNWPDSLRFDVAEHRRSEASCFGRRISRIDAWFRGPDGFMWHAVCRGDMDLATARRLKH